MRIHGNKIIKRRKIGDERKYPEYREELEEDFFGLCGYCGKNEYYFYELFHIDHFAPKSKFDNRKDDYSNLVLACPQCNRHKSNKWATDDAYTSIKDNEGFVDPATEEYDKHLHRDENGKIIADTKVGEYMYNAFKFNIRPTSMIWKINKLRELKETLKNDSSERGRELYQAMDIQLEKLLTDMVFKNKE